MEVAGWKSALAIHHRDALVHPFIVPLRCKLPRFAIDINSHSGGFKQSALGNSIGI
jgi:hypothetical protein